MPYGSVDDIRGNVHLVHLYQLAAFVLDRVVCVTFSHGNGLMTQNLGDFGNRRSTHGEITVCGVAIVMPVNRH